MAVDVKASTPAARTSAVNATTSGAGVRPAALASEARSRGRTSARRAHRVERAGALAAGCSRRDRDEWAWLVAVAAFTVLMGVLLGLFGGSGDVRLEPVGEVHVSEGWAGILWDADR